MAYQRPPFRSPFSAFALQNPMPIPGQFFNAGPPMNRPPLIQGLPNPGFRMPPQLRPPMGNMHPHQPHPHQQQHPRGPPPPLQMQQHQQQQQNHPQPPPQKFRLGSPPKTTVFVGNISEEVETDLLQKICEECGAVNSLRRLAGANGKPQAFGFCEFNHPDATRRSLRLLNGFILGGKPLLIKVEEKVMNQIREYMNALRQENGLLPLPIGAELPLTDEERDSDLLSKNRIIEMIEAVDKNLLRQPDPPPPEPKKEEKKIVSSSSDSEEERREEERNRSKQRRKHHHRSSRSRSPQRNRSSRSPRRGGERGSKRERSPRSDRSSNKKSKRRRHSESEEDETKRRERQKIKEREMAYEKRLKKWEEKEIRFAREVEKDREKERQRQKTRDREAEKLLRFHEDYDDSVNDTKYYRGDVLIQRRRNFEQQLEKDRKDREEEDLEFEKMKNEIMASNPEKFKNIEEEARKRQENEEAKINIKLGIKPSPRLHNITPSENDDEEDKNGDPATFKIDPTTTTTAMAINNNAGWESVDSPSTSIKLPSLGKKINVQTTRVSTNGLFTDDVDEEEESRQKKKLQMFKISSEERYAAATPEERKRMIRELIDKIPKARDQIFEYPIKWEYLDEPMIESRIRPWVAKKVLNYIGEDEPALVTFICDCVKKRTDPKKLVLDLSMVFDEESESFITKMWRLIIYETEARYKGLSALPTTSATTAAATSSSSSATNFLAPPS